MKVQVFLKVNPNSPVTVENLESVIVGSDAKQISAKMKTLPIVINRSQTYTFVGKEKSIIIEGNDILYLMTEKD